MQAPSSAPVLKPPLKWAGGKRWLVKHLRPLWERHGKRRLVEPFCGGLSVVLGLAPERALLNDGNPHLVAFYRWLQRGLVIDVRMQNQEDQFYVCRARFNELIRHGGVASAEAAGLFYYLNRTCFNGLCRFNRSGEFNVPFGRYRTIRYRQDFLSYVPTLSLWEFRSGDFESVPLEPEDFVYADPPYDVQFTQYAKEGFGWEQQERTASWLARHRGPVVLSNQATDRIVALYSRLGYELRFLDAPRRISCNGDRTPVREVVATRNL